MVPSRLRFLIAGPSLRAGSVRPVGGRGRAWRAAGLSLALLGSALADISGGGTAGDRDRSRDRDREPSAVVAPLPREVSGEVRCGESVELVLQAFGTREAPVEFELETAPRVGTVTAIEPLPDHPNAAVLRFDASAVAEPGLAVFEFRARRRSGGPSSAPVRGVVRILAPEVRLFTPEILDLGQVALGDPGRVALELENGSRLPLRLRVDLSGLAVRWADGGEAAREVHLPATGMVSLPLVWDPHEPGRLLGKVPVETPQGIRELPLRGVAVEAVAVQPQWLEPVTPTAAAEDVVEGGGLVGGPDADSPPAGGEGFPPGEGEPARDLPALTIVNRSARVLQARIEGGEALGLPPTLELPARGEVKLQPEFAAGEGGRGGEGLLRLGTERGELTVPWRVPAVPATLELNLAGGGQLPEVLDFGPLALGQERSVQLVMRNVGGEGGSAQLRTKPPFLLAYDASRPGLGPGQARELELGVRAEVLGVHEGVVDFGFAERRRELRLRVEVVRPETVAPQLAGDGQVEGQPMPSSSRGSGAASVAPGVGLSFGAGEAGNAGADWSNPATARDAVTNELLAQLPRTAEGSSERGQALERILFSPRAPRNIEFPILLRMGEMKRHSMELSWPLPERGDLADLKWQLSWIGVGSGDWQPIDAPVTIDLEQKVARVRLEGLRAGANFPLRITARTGEGGPIVSDYAWRLALPQPKPWIQVLWQSGRWAILALSVAGVGWYCWERWRPWSSERHQRA